MSAPAAKTRSPPYRVAARTGAAGGVGGDLPCRLRDLLLELRVQRVHLRPVQPDRRDLVRNLNPHELAHAVHLHAPRRNPPLRSYSGAASRPQAAGDRPAAPGGPPGVI